MPSVPVIERNSIDTFVTVLRKPPSCVHSQTLSHDPSLSAQGVTVVAAVAGTLLLTNKADQLKDSQRRTALGEPPSSADSLIHESLASIPDKSTSDAALPAPSIQTTQQGGKYARPMRMSQALEETERLPGVQHAPVKVSEFAKRLERAEQLEKEVRGKA